MPFTEKFVSAVATNGHVKNKSKTNPFEKTTHYLSITSWHVKML